MGSKTTLQKAGRFAVRLVLIVVCAGIWGYVATYMGVPSTLVGLGAFGIALCFIIRA